MQAVLPSPSSSGNFLQNWCCSSTSSQQSLRPLKRINGRAKARLVQASSTSSEPSVPSTSSTGVQLQNAETVNGNSSPSAVYAVSNRVVEWPPVAEITGGALDFKGATEPLTAKPVAAGTRVMLVRHGLSTWNFEGRIQGSSNQSMLSEKGILQAHRCGQALSKLKFDRCYASPISRAKSTAEVIWSGREEPLLFLDNLKEANLLFLEGMRNEDAKKQYPQLYKAWREDPANFSVNGVYPVVKLWTTAKDAWGEILTASDELVLVVTHKSMLRAMICAALGLQPDKFRSIDINNSGISSFTVNKRGEPMLQSLNMTAHLHADGVYYF